MEEFEKQLSNVEIKIEVTEVEDGMWEKNPKSRGVFSRENLPEYMNCSNPICYAGGISIGGIVRDNLKTNKEEIIVRKKCPGYKGSKKGRKNYGNCAHTFIITVTQKN